YVQVNPHQDLKDKGVIDSGRSRHMTGNRSYLIDYKEIDGGFVAFGGNSKGGKITGKAIAITLDLPTVEPEDSLTTGDEHLDTIPKMESDEFIKSSVENLVPTPSVSKDLFDSECGIDSLFDEFVDELILLKSIPPGIDETDCDPEEEICLIEKLLYDNSSPRPPEEFISKNFDAAIESFSRSPIPVEDSDSFMEEIDLSFTPDDSMPSGIENDDYDSEVDMLILEELLSNDSLSLLENESFDFDIPSSSRPPAKPPDDDLGILTVKVMGDIYEQMFLCQDFYPPNPPMIQIKRNLPISYLIGALKLLSILQKADDNLWREHSCLGCSISQFLSSLTSSSMGEPDQAKRP
nr:hypothetical protein [Tanacetum cinerariifolium]